MSGNSKTGTRSIHAASVRRSDCPISYALDLFGDKWTLLVVRDLALYAKRHYGELLASDERMATNILADRLARLEAWGVVNKQPDPTNRRRVIYRLTERGKDLLPVLVEMIRWSGQHDPASAAPPEFLRRIDSEREALLIELRAALDDPPGT